MINESYKNWSDIKYLDEIVSNPLISVGRKSYYSGYYSQKNLKMVVLDIFGVIGKQENYSILENNLAGN